MASSITTDFVQANGLCFEVLTYGSGNRLALCLHGFPECNYSWRYQIPLLAELGYQVWAPNLRGYGRSSRPKSVRDYGINYLLKDIAAIIEVSKCHSVLLIGHDWGAALSWLLAMDATLPLEGLIIMNVPHPTLFIKSLKTWKQLKKSWYIFFFQIPWLPEGLLTVNHAYLVGKMIQHTAADKTQFSDEVLNVYRDQATQPSVLRAMINYYRALVLESSWKKYGGNLPTIQVPTLMIWGEKDAALGKETTYGTENYVHDFTLHYLPYASHWVQQEAPMQVNQIMKEWVLNKIKISA